MTHAMSPLMIVLMAVMMVAMGGAMLFGGIRLLRKSLLFRLAKKYAPSRAKR
jgi:hypothetical protein